MNWIYDKTLFKVSLLCIYFFGFQLLLRYFQNSSKVPEARTGLLSLAPLSTSTVPGKGCLLRGSPPATGGKMTNHFQRRTLQAVGSKSLMDSSWSARLGLKTEEATVAPSQTQRDPAQRPVIWQWKVTKPPYFAPCMVQVDGRGWLFPISHAQKNDIAWGF